ncbi:MAG: type I methionyl aminopeptidase [Candidatus Portnoybacteria bacterium]|nr:type I methionyl aminopeptidase [Candidatus Portnoybacteria bacterium]
MTRLYNKKEINIMKRGGRFLAKILRQVAKEVRPGITTEYLNKVAEDLIFSYNLKPSFKGFGGFPAALCTSIDEEIVHGVPGKRVLKDGDMLSLDLGVEHEGYHSDMAFTLGIGNISKKKKKLISVTKKCLELAINQARAGNFLGDIGNAVESYAKENGLDVVKELVGHGVGKNLHEDPQVFNYGEKGQGIELKEGMVLALEPMVVAGGWKVQKTEDGFGYRTVDRSLSAHFEHSITVTKRGGVILTK